jgi:hypothetical protein
MFNHIVAKAVGEDLPRQRRNRHPSALPLEYVPEIFEVAVTSANGAVLELEGGDVRPADDLVVGVHAARCAVRLGVLDLEKGYQRAGRRKSWKGRRLLSLGSSQEGHISPRRIADERRAWPACWERDGCHSVERFLCSGKKDGKTSRASWPDQIDATRTVSRRESGCLGSYGGGLATGGS